MGGFDFFWYIGLSNHGYMVEQHFLCQNIKKQTKKIPFYVNACEIFQPEESHSPESFPWLGHKIFQLSLQL